jgi:hypothetical protein
MSLSLDSGINAASTIFRARTKRDQYRAPKSKIAIHQAEGRSVIAHGSYPYRAPCQMSRITES